MNITHEVGRLTRDPELRHNANNTAFCNFSVAVDRPMTKDKVDYPQVFCVGKTAENCAKYLSKGSQVAVIGSFQTGHYDNSDGKRIYTSKIFASRVEFLSKSKEVNTETNVDVDKKKGWWRPPILNHFKQ